MHLKKRVVSEPVYYQSIYFLSTTRVCIPKPASLVFQVLFAIFATSLLELSAARSSHVISCSSRRLLLGSGRARSSPGRHPRQGRRTWATTRLTVDTFS